MVSTKSLLLQLRKKQKVDKINILCFIFFYMLKINQPFPVNEGAAQTVPNRTIALQLLNNLTVYQEWQRMKYPRKNMLFQNK